MSKVGPAFDVSDTGRQFDGVRLGRFEGYKINSKNNIPVPQNSLFKRKRWEEIVKWPDQSLCHILAYIPSLIDLISESFSLLPTNL
jgi:hypothetical protein